MFGTKDNDTTTKPRGWGLGSAWNAATSTVVNLTANFTVDFDYLKPLTSELKPFLSKKIKDAFKTLPSQENGIYSVSDTDTLSAYQQYLLQAYNLCVSIKNANGTTLLSTTNALTQNADKEIDDEQEYEIIAKLSSTISKHLREKPKESLTRRLLQTTNATLRQKIGRYTLKKIDEIFKDKTPKEHREYLNTIELFFTNWTKETGQERKKLNEALDKIREQLNGEPDSTTLESINSALITLQRDVTTAQETLSSFVTNPVVLDYGDELEILANTTKTGAPKDELDKLNIIQAYQAVAENKNRMAIYGAILSGLKTQIVSLQTKLNSYQTEKQASTHKAVNTLLNEMVNTVEDRIADKKTEEEPDTDMQRMFDEEEQEANEEDELIIAFEEMATNSPYDDMVIDPAQQATPDGLKDILRIPLFVIDYSQQSEENQYALLNQHQDHHRFRLIDQAGHVTDRLLANDPTEIINSEFDRISPNTAIQNDLKDHVTQHDLMFLSYNFGARNNKTNGGIKTNYLQKPLACFTTQKNDGAISVRSISGVLDFNFKSDEEMLKQADKMINEKKIFDHRKLTIDAIVELTPKTEHKRERKFVKRTTRVYDFSLLPYLVRIPEFYTAKLVNAIEPAQIPELVNTYNEKYNTSLPTFLLNVSLDDYIHLLKENHKNTDLTNAIEIATNEKKKKQIKIYHIGHQLMIDPNKLTQAEINATASTMIDEFDFLIQFAEQSYTLFIDQYLEQADRSLQETFLSKTYDTYCAQALKKNPWAVLPPQELKNLLGEQYIKFVITNNKDYAAEEASVFINNGKNLAEKAERQLFIISLDNTNQHLNLYIQLVVSNNLGNASEKIKTYLDGAQDIAEALKQIVSWDKTGACIKTVFDKAFLNDLDLTDPEKTAFIAAINEKKLTLYKRYGSKRYKALNALGKRLAKLTPSETSSSDANSDGEYVLVESEPESSDDEEISVAEKSSADAQTLPSEPSPSIIDGNLVPEDQQVVATVPVALSEEEKSLKDKKGFERLQIRGLTDNDFAILTNLKTAQALDPGSLDIVRLLRATAINYDRRRKEAKLIHERGTAIDYTREKKIKEAKLQKKAFLLLISRHHIHGLNYIKRLKKDELNLESNLLELITANATLLNKHLPKHFKKKTLRYVLQQALISKTPTTIDQLRDILNNKMLLKKIKFKSPLKKVKDTADRKNLFINILTLAAENTDPDFNDQLFKIFGRKTLISAIEWLYDDNLIIDERTNELRRDLTNNQDFLNPNRSRRKSKTLGMKKIQTGVSGQKGNKEKYSYYAWIKNILPLQEPVKELVKDAQPSTSTLPSSTASMTAPLGIEPTPSLSTQPENLPEKGKILKEMPQAAEVDAQDEPSKNGPAKKTNTEGPANTVTNKP